MTMFYSKDNQFNVLQVQWFIGYEVDLLWYTSGDTLFLRLLQIDPAGQIGWYTNEKLQRSQKSRQDEETGR